MDLSRKDNTDWHDTQYTRDATKLQVFLTITFLSIFPLVSPYFLPLLFLHSHPAFALLHLLSSPPLIPPFLPSTSIISLSLLYFFPFFLFLSLIQFVPFSPFLFLCHTSFSFSSSIPCVHSLFFFHTSFHSSVLYSSLSMFPPSPFQFLPFSLFLFLPLTSLSFSFSVSSSLSLLPFHLSSSFSSSSSSFLLNTRSYIYLVSFFISLVLLTYHTISLFYLFIIFISSPLLPPSSLSFLHHSNILYLIS